MKYYAGIGSRETPEPVCTLMRHIARMLRLKGYILRSGGADSADKAFADGAGIYRKVYLPWVGFNGWPTADVTGIVCGEDEALRLIAARHHPAWSRLREPVRKLMTRNSAQILGRGFGEPISEFVICWTPEGKGGGGTGQAIRVARAHNVPVFDLALPEGLAAAREIC